MKFDLFDAMGHMRQHFGTDGEILLTQNEESLGVILRVFRFGTWHNSEFRISRLEVSDAYVNTMNELFRYHIDMLCELITNYEP